MLNTPNPKYFCSNCDYTHPSHLPPLDDDCPDCGQKLAYAKPRRRNRIPLRYIIIFAALFLIIPIGYALIPRVEDPYDGPPESPPEVLSTISIANATAIKNCIIPGNTEPTWVCPQVTRDQARIAIARSITKAVEAHATNHDPHVRYSQEAREKLTEQISQRIVLIDTQGCAPEHRINLPPDILATAQSSAYVEPCPRGWRLTAPWREVLDRQTPLPPPNLAEYRHKIHSGLIP